MKNFLYYLYNIFEKTVCVLLVVFLPQLLSAQQLQPGPSFRHLTTDDGLPSSEVYEIHQDKNGYIWFGTDNGLSRYDGYKFKNYGAAEGLNSNVVFHLYKDTKDRLWMNTLLGDVYYYQNDSIYPYKFNHIIREYKGQFIAPGDLHIDQEENLYLVLSGAGILKINAQGEDELFGENHYGGFITETDQTALVVNCFMTETEAQREEYKATTYKDSLSVFKFFNGQKIISSFFQYENIGAGQITEIVRISDRELLIWFRCHLFYFKDYNLVWKRPSSCPISFMSMTDDGEIFFSPREGRGTLMFKNMEALEKGESDVFLTQYFISDVYKDQSGTYWFSTLENGVFYTNNFQIKVYDESAGLLNQNISSITPKNDKELFFSDRDNNIYNLNTQEHTTEQLPLTKQKPPIFSIFYDSLHQRLWSGAFPYFFYDFNNKVWEPIKRPFHNWSSAKTNAPKIVKISPDKKYLWGTYYAGFQKFSLEEAALHFLSKDIGFSERVFVVFESKEGELWIGTGRGLFRLPKDNLGAIKEMEPELGIRIEDIEQMSDHKMLVGTKGAGVIMFDGDTQQSFTVQEGLTSNMIEHVKVDSFGNIWVGTLNGLNQIYWDNEHQEYRINQFTKAHGLPSGEINEILVDGNTLWIATAGGLVRFSINQLAESCIQREVLIESFKINGETQPLQKKYELSYNDNTIQIEFITLNYGMNGQIEYRYRLRKNAPWINTNSRIANFINLSYGAYEFEVQSKNENGNWSPSRILPFIIKKPLWLRTDFIVVLALFFALIIWYLISSYIKRIRKDAEVARQINDLKTSALQAQMNPHFVFNCLNAIQSFIANQQTDKATRYLAKFAMLVRNNLNASIHKVVTLEEEIQTIENYLSFEKMRFQKKLNYTIEVDPNLNIYEIEIPPLLTLPYVENAVIHGLLQSPRQGELEINYTKENNYVGIEIRDNGLGVFQTQKKKQKSQLEGIHKSVGMSISKKMLEIFNEGLGEKDLIIEERFNDDGKIEGTRIKLRIKVKNTEIVVE